MTLGKHVCCVGILSLISILLSPLTAVGGEQDDLTYQTLVDRAKAGELTIDFRALRLACIRASHCEPRGSATDLTAMSVEDPRKALEVAKKLIEDGFANLEAHATAAGAYARLNEQEKANAHLAI